LVAVEEAFATHYSAVFRQVQRLMRDPDDSYDLTLTAWEKAQRAWDRRPSVALEIKPWLFRIARNACVDELRRRQLVRWEPLEGTRRASSGDSKPVAPAALLIGGGLLRGRPWVKTPAAAVLGGYALLGWSVAAMG